MDEWELKLLNATGNLMSTDSPTLMATADLVALIQKLFVKQGMFAAQANQVAKSTLWAEVVGQPAFGMALVPRMLSASATGAIDPRGQLLASSPAPGIQEVVGSRLPGGVALDKAQSLAIKALAEQPAINVLVTLSQPAWPGTCAIALAAVGAVAKVTLTGGTAPVGGPYPIQFPYTVWGLPAADGKIIVVENPVIGGPSENEEAATVAEAPLFEQPVEFVLTAFKDEMSEIIVAQLGSQGRECPSALPVEFSLTAVALGHLRDACEQGRIPCPW